jgi:ABC-type polar amino acid transport system ATPase subunit
VRGGLKAVPNHYVEWARVAGFSRWQIWRYVTAPIAYRLMLAPLFGQYINQVKLSVLASIIAVPELLHTVNTITTETFRPLELYTTLAFIFLLILLPATWLQGWLEARQTKLMAKRPALAADDEGRPDGRFDSRLRSAVMEGWRSLPEGTRLVARDLEHAFRETSVLKDVSLEAEQGRVTAIIGANGSGKTTLLRCLAGILQPQAGRVELLGPAEPYRDNLASVRFGYMTQEHQPLPHLSVLENIMLPLIVRDRLSRSEAEEIATHWLNVFRLSQKKSARPTELSGGQRQRLVLAATLCLRPQVLLLDEPVSAMDFRWSLFVQDFMRELADHGVIVVVVSHGLGFLRKAADTIVFLDRRTVCEAGPASRLIESPRTPALRSFLEAA